MAKKVKDYYDLAYAMDLIDGCKQRPPPLMDKNLACC